MCISMCEIPLYSSTTTRYRINFTISSQSTLATHHWVFSIYTDLSHPPTLTALHYHPNTPQSGYKSSNTLSNLHPPPRQLPPLHPTTPSRNQRIPRAKRPNTRHPTEETAAGQGRGVGLCAALLVFFQDRITMGNPKVGFSSNRKERTTHMNSLRQVRNRLLDRCVQLRVPRAAAGANGLRDVWDFVDVLLFVSSALSVFLIF